MSFRRQWGFSQVNWPFGDDGDLHISNGETVSLSAGTVKDYNSLTIDSGGILELTGEGWLRIGVKGDLVLNGTLRAQNIDGTTGATYSSNEIDPQGNNGAAISYTINQQNGGGGGYNGTANYNAQGYGNGGGGRGGDMYYEAGGGWLAGQNSYYGNPMTGTITYSGFGGNGTNYVGDVASSSGSVGVSVYSANGNSAATNTGYQSSGGGSGGTRAKHGAGLWIKVKGQISGSGTINVKGGVGGNGGAGGGDNYTADNMHGAPGNGGGGGAGGSSGKVLLYYGSSSITFSTQILVAGGAGGAAGPRGSDGHTSVNSGHGGPGQAGTNGENGSYTATQI